MSAQLDDLEPKLRHLLATTADDGELCAFLTGFQPADIAAVLLPLAADERARVLAAVEPAFAARIVASLEYDEQLAIVRALPRPVSAPILEAMSSDDLADLLAEADPEEADSLLELIPEGAEEVRELMRYPETSAGGIMTPDFIAVPESHTVDQTLAHLRALQPDSETAYYVYVTDAAGALKGVVSLRQLVVSQPGTVIGDIVTGDVVAVPAETDQEEVARLFERYDFLALPVVDDQRRLLGVVTVDDVIDVIHEETDEDISRMGAVEPLDALYLTAHPLHLVRKRIGWLLVLFGAQSVTGNILEAYQETLAAATVLAIFIPLLIGTGGNAGTQASTLVVRAMAVGELSFRDVLRVIGRESLVGFLLGLIMALAAFSWSQIFGTGFSIGLAVGLAVLSIVVLASTVGATLPILARRLGFDPAVASAPLVTTVTDASGLLVYFLIARKVLGL